jgi:hypothetical protein
MRLLSWLHLRNSSDTARQRPATPRLRPCIDAMEDRCLLSGYQQINLVGYEAGIAHATERLRLTCSTQG